MDRYDGARAIAQPAGPKCSVVVTDGVQSLVGVSKTQGSSERRNRGRND